MSIEHNPAPLTDEEWDRITKTNRAFCCSRTGIDALRAAGVTVEPPPAPRYSVVIRDFPHEHATHRIHDNFSFSDESIVAPHGAVFNDEDDAETWCAVLNGKAKIVYTEAFK